jgi:AcrR family transcriptional regulator
MAKTKRGSWAGKQQSRVDWLRTGEDILREKDHTHLNLLSLTRRLGVTTGSFYHHFRDMKEFKSALAEQFDGAEIVLAMRQASRQSNDPRTRLRHLAKINERTGLYSLHAAMLDWATVDKAAAAAVVRAEELVFRYYTKAFVEMGFSLLAARLRTRLLIAAKLSHIRSDTSMTQLEFQDDALEFLMRPQKQSSRPRRPKS